MSNFTFSAPGSCQYCGTLLGHGEDCDNCSKEQREQHFFRGIGSTEPETLTIESTMDFRWYKLANEIGQDWIKYEWLGTRDDVNGMIGIEMWDDIREIPRRQHPTEVPEGPDPGTDESEQNT